MSKSKEKSSVKKDRIASLMISFAFLVFTIAGFLGVYLYKTQQDAIDGGVIVKAEIVGVAEESMKESGNLTNWTPVYEYIDENGVKYTGYGTVTFQHEYEARSLIGTKIDIYIDGKGHSIAVGGATGTKEALTMAIICLIIFLIAFSVYIWQLVNRRKLEAKLAEKLLAKEQSEKVVENTDTKLDNGVNVEDIQKDELTTDVIEITNSEEK